MSKIKKLNIVNFALFVVSICVGAFLSNGVIMFGAHPTRHFNLGESLVCLSVLAISVAALIFINVKNRSFKPNYILISLLSLLFISNMITLLVFQNRDFYTFVGIDGNQYSFNYYIDAETKVVYIISFLGLLISTYLLLDIAYQSFDLKRLLLTISFIVFACLIVFMIYSYITEFDDYIGVLSHLTDNKNYQYMICSFFPNKNSYAIVLSLGIIASLYCFFYLKKWYYILIGCFIYLNVIWTLSKFLIIIDAFIVFLFVLFAIKRINKLSKKQKIIIVSVCLSVMMIIAIAATIVLAVLNKTHDGYNTFETRTWIWWKSFEVIGLNNIFTGAGHILFGDLLILYNTTDPVSLPVNNTSSAHNAIIEALGNGGILLLLVGIAIYGMIVYMIVKSFKNNKELSVISISLFILFSLYMTVESASFLMPKALESCVLSSFIITPIISTYKNSPKAAK